MSMPLHVSFRVGLKLHDQGAGKVGGFEGSTPQLSVHSNPGQCFSCRLYTCWCTDAFVEQFRCTCRKVAHKQPTSSVNTCDPPVSGRWSFRGIDWTVMVVGVSLLRARRPGIRCQTVLAFSGVTTWKHFFCEILMRRTQCIRDFLWECARLYLLTYLLTYLPDLAFVSWLFHIYTPTVYSWPI